MDDDPEEMRPWPVERARDGPEGAAEGTEGATEGGPEEASERPSERQSERVPGGVVDADMNDGVGGGASGASGDSRATTPRRQVEEPQERQSVPDLRSYGVDAGRDGTAE